MRKYGHQGGRKDTAAYTAAELAQYARSEIQELEQFYCIGTREYYYMRAFVELADRVHVLDTQVVDTK